LFGSNTAFGQDPDPIALEKGCESACCVNDTGYCLNAVPDKCNLCGERICKHTTDPQTGTVTKTCVDPT
jgi:hypothetical protein